MTRYDQDFYAWTQEQAALLKEKRFGELDIEHLVEEVEDMGKSVQRELESRLIVLMAHLLKWYYQPESRSRSWRLTIREQRRQIDRLVTKNPSLRPVLAAEYQEVYDLACLRAAQETDREPETFPAQCPWTLEQILKDTDPR
jgi:hypothetical protein